MSLRAMVQQDLDEARHKWEMGLTSAGNIIHCPDMTATRGSLMGTGAPGTQVVVASPNFQQPYYQT
jgi:hypothetical protein